MRAVGFAIGSTRAQRAPKECSFFVVSGDIISRRLIMISHTFPGSIFLHEAFPSLIPAGASALWFRVYAGGCASDPLVPYFAFFPQLGYDGYTTQ